MYVGTMLIAHSSQHHIKGKSDRGKERQRAAGYQSFQAIWFVGIQVILRARLMG